MRQPAVQTATVEDRLPSRPNMDLWMTITGAAWNALDLETRDWTTAWTSSPCTPPSPLSPSLPPLPLTSRSPDPQTTPPQHSRLPGHGPLPIGAQLAAAAPAGSSASACIFKRHTTRPTAMAEGQRKAQEDALLNVIHSAIALPLRRAHVRNNGLSRIFLPKDAGAKWRKEVGRNAPTKSEPGDQECGRQCWALAQDHEAHGMERRSADLGERSRECQAVGPMRS